MRVTTRPALQRILAIDIAVRRLKWPNARTLARELKVTRRTIQRDIEFMRDRLHAPLEFDIVHNGYFYTDPSYRLCYFPVTEGELGRVDKTWAVLRSAGTGCVGWVELAKRAQDHRDRQMVGRRPGQPGLDPPYGPTLAYLLSTRTRTNGQW